MRYQERIYIQNQFNGLKNRSVSNVNMSSDLCVFSQPTFNMTGATKIQCFDECSCPSGYTLNEDGTCIQMISSAATFNGVGSTIVAGNTSNVYGSYGTYFYPSIENNANLPVFYTGNSAVLYDSANNIIPPTNIATGNAFWGNGTFMSGRLNNIGLSASTTEYLGFSKCFELEETGIYYVGLAADNSCRFRLNGKFIANFSSNTANDNFKTWSIFPFELSAGLHIIELEGKNSSSATAFGAEIYKPTSLAVLTGSTSTGTTGLVFSTLNERGQFFDLGTTIGYTCASGYSLNICTSGTPTCIKISRIDCPNVVTGSTSGSVHTITTATTVPISFTFTGNTNSFSANNATFKYEVYKYLPAAGIFINPPVFKSENIPYSAFSNTNILNQDLSIVTLQPDGEYIVKGYYEFGACTEFMSRLGKKIDTLQFKNGDFYQLYDPKHDYYLNVVTQPSVPLFLNTEDAPLLTPAPLFQEVIFLDTEDGPTDTFEINGEFNGDVIITLNGAVLSVEDDYLINDNIVTMNDFVSTADTITAIYNKIGGINVAVKTINVLSIPSGATGTQGTSNIFYNTTTNKYEVFLDTSPINDAGMIVRINQATLTNNVDYYKSITNPKRIILEGDILINDMILVVYYPQASLINGVTAKNSNVVWRVDNAPTLNNGKFILELSPNLSFSSITYSAVTDYEVNVSTYSSILQVAGAVGTNLYYRVRNQKNFKNICDDNVVAETFSDVIPITITSNSINSY